MNFNIFKILEKDDKELIHSSFLSFLIKEDSNFSKIFLGIELSDTYRMKLESSYSYGKAKKKKKCRFDLEIIESNKITVIENKFKSFPTQSQLDEYDLALNEKFPKLTKQKFLLCFDSILLESNNGWIIKDYSCLLNYLKSYLISITDNDKKVFVKHYIYFLKEYIDKYAEYKLASKELFQNQFNNINKFWIRLLYSNIQIELYKYFKLQNIDVNIYLAPGNTNLPLLNITPTNWRIDGIELLIQIQNGDFKFYAHTDNKDFLRKMVDFSKLQLVSPHLKYKNIGNKKEKTAYIFKLNIHKQLKDEEELNISSMTEWIIQYYNSINEKIIRNYR